MRGPLLCLLLTACPPGPGGSSEPRTPTPAEPATPETPASPSSDAPATANGVFRVDMLDVGQGDAILLRSPGGRAVLIDAGTGQKGEAALPLLQELGVAKLDLVVATHPHADHIGGLDDVVEKLPIKLLTDNGLPHTTDTYDKLMRLVESKGISYKAARAGQTYSLDGGVRLEVLNPAGEPITGTRSDLNANSVVIRATHGRNCMLLTGDAEEETEERLLHRGVQPCDVLKAAHHGSGYASTAPFLDAVKPQVVLISAGQGNSYGHPDPAALERYAAAGARVLRTDQGGTLRAESDGTTITITPARGASVTVRGKSRPVVAPGRGEPAPAPGASSSGAGGLLDLNRASVAELEALPGVGPKLAQAIVDDRATNGPFATIDALDRVPGVGPATIEQIRAQVTAGP